MKNVVIMVIIAITLAISLCACTQASKSTIEDEIIAAACQEIGVAPTHTELHLISKEYVPHLECYTYTYRMVADNETYIVDVNGTDTEVYFVDVIRNERDRV